MIAKLLGYANIVWFFVVMFLVAIGFVHPVLVFTSAMTNVPLGAFLLLWEEL